IAYAHSHQVLHRDLKPDNIMLGEFGETLVVDWGLAKIIGGAEGARPTHEALQPGSVGDSDGRGVGTGLGTPLSRSPEQAASRLDQVGSASDVYGLGATLYCLVTGRPPFVGSSAAQTLQKVQEGEFPPPREVNRAVPRPLDAICLKAMALRPEDRYV